MTRPITLDEVEVEFKGVKHTYSSQGRPYKLAVSGCCGTYVSGVVPYSNQGLVSNNFEEQVEFVLTVITEVAKKIGGSCIKTDKEAKKSILKLTVYVVDLDKGKYDALNQVFNDFFKNVGYFPARTTIGVASIPIPGALVEIDAVLDI